MAKQKATESGFTFPDFWIRYVDDILVYWKQPLEELDSFVHFLIGLRPSFLVEHEREGLSYLSRCSFQVIPEWPPFLELP